MSHSEQQVKSDLTVDEFKLDQEWVGQARLYFSYASDLADARRRQDEAKNEVEVIRAELDRSVREDPQKYGLVKVTETAVAAAVLTQSDYTRATSDLVNIRYEVNILEAAVQAMEHRKRALENLVSLHLASYYSEPKAKDASEAQDEWEKGAIRRRSQRGV